MAHQLNYSLIQNTELIWNWDDQLNFTPTEPEFMTSWAEYSSLFQILKDVCWYDQDKE